MGNVIALVVFWAGLALVAYSYAGYPLLLWLWARRAARPLPPPLEPAALPQLSLLIAAHDEEGVIVNKLANCAALDYPADRLEVLVGSDGSRDATNELVRKHGGPNVRLLDFEAWRGKAAVLNDLMAAAQGEVLVFSDANTQLEPPALKRLAAHFADPRVGAVGGHLVLHRAATAAGGADESLYWRFETALKAWEGQLGLLAAAPGALHAQRRALARPVPVQRMISDDLFLAGSVLLQGYAVTYAPTAVGHETAAAETRGELRRKIRVAETAYNTLPYLWPLLLPGRGQVSARVAWMFWSHKLLRWLVPFLMLGIFGANLFLLDQPLYQLAFVGQAGFYAAAALGYVVEHYRPPPKWLSFPYYFTGANLALLVGCLRSLTRPATPTWSRAAR